MTNAEIEEKNGNLAFINKDNKGCFLFVIVLFAIIIGLLAYFLGRKNGTKTIENIATNNTFITEIAELSTLEANGIATIKSSNITNDGSFTDEIKKLFLEKTINISVPYTAKYGVDLENQGITIEEKSKQVFIVLPDPKLLSYELRLDKAGAQTRKGLLESSNDEVYNSIEKKLYSQSRTQLEQNQAYIRRSKEKITQLLKAYYEPLKLHVEVTFKSELKSKVIEKLD